MRIGRVGSEQVRDGGLELVMNRCLLEDDRNTER